MANFSQSSEYIDDTDAGTHVVGVYESLLQRAAETDMYALFETGLRNSSTSLTAVATYVYDGTEYQGRFS